MKYAYLSLVLLLLPTSAIARGFEFRAIASDGTYRLCTEIYWSPYYDHFVCYELVRKKLVSLGLAIIQQWTGVYDTAGKKIYEGDRIATPGYPNGIVVFGYEKYLGWAIRGDDGNYYLFSDLSSQSPATWSTIIN